MSSKEIENNPEDRYVSFVGIDCDANAEQLMLMLDNNIKAAKGETQWHLYFTKKREQQAQLKHDSLNFIGHQTNTLYEYFTSCNDKAALELLYKIEQQCC